MRIITTNGHDNPASRKITQEQIVTVDSNGESLLGLELGIGTNGVGINSNIVNTSFEAATQTYQRLVAEGEVFLELSRQLEADAKMKFREVLNGLESIELETQAYRDQIATDQQQALGLIKVEAEAYRDKIIGDAQQILNDAELARNETQKILTAAAKIREEAHEILRDIRQQLEGSQDSGAA